MQISNRNTSKSISFKWPIVRIYFGKVLHCSGGNNNFSLFAQSDNFGVKIFHYVLMIFGQPGYSATGFLFKLFFHH